MKGPKEWVPSQIARAGEMFGVSPEDKKTLREIEKACKEQRYSNDAGGSILFLLDLVDRLSRWRFEEFDFPRYAALVNQAACNAYPCAFEELVTIEKGTSLTTEFGSHACLLDWRPVLSVLQAVLVVRPLVRYPARLAEAQREELRNARLSMYHKSEGADRIALISRAPLAQFEVPEETQEVRKRPFCFSGIPIEAFAATHLSFPDNVAFLEQPYGVFITHDTQVTVSLEMERAVSAPVNMWLSLLAARYVAKGELLNAKAAP